MQWQSTHGKEAPKHSLFPPNTKHILDAQNSNVQSPLLPVSFIDIATRWGAETLHRIAGGSKESRRNDIDQKMQRSRSVSNTIAVSMVQSSCTQTLVVVAVCDNDKYGVENEDQTSSHTTEKDAFLPTMQAS